MCKTLLAWHRSGPATPAHAAHGSAAATPPQLVAHCACQALAAIQSAGGAGDGRGAAAARARACAALLEAEALPQAARWHRRDLVPALLAAWRAVLRALARRAAPGPPLAPPAARLVAAAATP
jgi:hypothetical protein